MNVIGLLTPIIKSLAMYIIATYPDKEAAKKSMMSFFNKQ